MIPTNYTTITHWKENICYVDENPHNETWNALVIGYGSLVIIVSTCKSVHASKSRIKKTIIIISGFYDMQIRDPFDAYHLYK